MKRLNFITLLFPHVSGFSLLYVLRASAVTLPWANASFAQKFPF